MFVLFPVLALPLTFPAAKTLVEPIPRVFRPHKYIYTYIHKWRSLFVVCLLEVSGDLEFFI